IADRALRGDRGGADPAPIRVAARLKSETLWPEEEPNDSTQVHRAGDELLRRVRGDVRDRQHRRRSPTAPSRRGRARLREDAARVLDRRGEGPRRYRQDRGQEHLTGAGPALPLQWPAPPARGAGPPERAGTPRVPLPVARFA